MNSRTEETLENLRKDGARITKARRSIVDFILSASSPLTVPDIHEALSLKLPINLATVYRELGFLVERGLVREIDFMDGKKRYEFEDSTHAHSHLVCKECENVECVEIDSGIKQIEKSLEGRHKFKISNRVLEFFGLCSKCDKENS